METKEKLEKTINVLQSSMRSLRVGRASVDMVEGIEVNVYDTPTPLNQVASISIPQPNQILIQPWDPSNMEAVQSAITKSNLQLNPVAESNAVRLTMPPLTEEDRKKTVKEAADFAEQARVSVRNIREEAMKDLEDAEKQKTISEDDKFMQEKEIQKLVDEYNKKTQEALDRKEKEIMS